jgi:hypothetical protein
MNFTNLSAATGQPQPEIRIGKCCVPAEVEGQMTELELFTMTLGEEAIYLLPLRTWSQLDVHKWRAQGKLPGTPPGLDIALNQVKMGGECVALNDPEGCQKLEAAFNGWLALERQALEEARKKAEPASEPAASSTEPEALRFQVDLDKTGQPHIRCLEGKETVGDVACNGPGITSLLNEGLMRKPANWKVGALRDWVELDGKMFRLKEGKEGLAAFERTLNERYHPGEDGQGQHVKVFPNPASTTGFDIQFPAIDNGLIENRRRHLDPDAMQLLSDPHRCRVLRRGLLVKFTPPTFHFKQQTPDGGESDLDPTPENTVWVRGKDRQQRLIDLSQPFSHLGLDATGLAAIFNHPSLCRRVRRPQEETWRGGLDQAA